MSPGRLVNPKPAGPPRPLLSTGAVAIVCATAFGVAFLVFAHERPDMAIQVMGGFIMIVFSGTLIFLLKL